MFIQQLVGMSVAFAGLGLAIITSGALVAWLVDGEHLESPRTTFLGFVAGIVLMGFGLWLQLS